MDKQKQIEEMAKDLKEEKLYALINKTSYTRSAENLYDLGYRKIPENAVVLTDKKDIQQYEWSKLIDKMGVIKFGEKLRKETAEKFAETLENRLDSIDIILHEDNGEEYLSANELGELIDEICKEITEGKV